MTRCDPSISPTPSLLGSFGEVAVDSLRERRAAGHGPDQKRGAEWFPQKRRAEVDVPQVGFGQSAVGQIKTFKARGARFVLNVVVEASFDVPEFARRCVGRCRLVACWVWQRGRGHPAQHTGKTSAEVR